MFQLLPAFQAKLCLFSVLSLAFGALHIKSIDNGFFNASILDDSYLVVNGNLGRKLEYHVK